MRVGGAAESVPDPVAANLGLSVAPPGGGAPPAGPKPGAAATGGLAQRAAPPPQPSPLQTGSPLCGSITRLI